LHASASSVEEAEVEIAKYIRSRPLSDFEDLTIDPWHTLLMHSLLIHAGGATTSHGNNAATRLHQYWVGGNKTLVAYTIVLEEVILGVDTSALTELIRSMNSINIPDTYCST